MDQETEEYIEGLILQDELESLKSSVRTIVQDLQEEGFDRDDVRDYLKNQVDTITIYEYL